MEAEVRLINMDAVGIDFQVLSPNPLTYFHHIDASDAVRFCEQHNNALAEIVLAHSTLDWLASRHCPCRISRPHARN